MGDTGRRQQWPTSRDQLAALYLELGDLVRDLDGDGPEVPGADAAVPPAADASPPRPAAAIPPAAAAGRSRLAAAAAATPDVGAPPRLAAASAAPNAGSPRLSAGAAGGGGRGSGIAAGAAVPAAAARPRRRRSRIRLLVALAGVGLMVAGVVVIALPLVGVWQRGRADDSALQQWQAGGSANLVGAGPGTADPTPSACSAANAPKDDYALVTFPSLSQFGYAGVAGEGNWDVLKDRSMVHYTGTAAPGQQGNSIIAFHREPHYEHIDQLKVGDIVDVQDRSCAVWHYRVTQRWELSPDRVTQLVPTSGHDLTLITCTPWWRDYNRLVWRASLVGA